MAAKIDARGWSEEAILKTIEQAASVVVTRDRRHLLGGFGETRDDPALAYIAADGNYVVVNSLTGEVIAISDRTDPGWRTPDWGRYGR